MAIQLPNGRNYFEATGGGPGVGYRLYAFVPGTSTPKETFTTSAASVANAHPVVMNVRGEAAIYWEGSYDVVLHDAADALVWGPERLEETGSADDLEDRLADTSIASNGDFLLGVKSTLTGSVARTQHDKNAERLSLFDFIPVAQQAAIVGFTSVYDATAAIHLAFAVADGRELFAPAGLYNHTALQVPKASVLRLVGEFASYDGTEGTVFNYTGSGIGLQVGVDDGNPDSTGPARANKITGIHFKTSTGSSNLRIQNTALTEVHGNVFRGASGKVIDLRANVITRVYLNDIAGSQPASGNYGIYCDEQYFGQFVTEIFDNHIFQLNHAGRFAEGRNLNVHRNIVENIRPGASGGVWKFDTSGYISNCTFRDNYYENHRGYIYEGASFTGAILNLLIQGEDAWGSGDAGNVNPGVGNLPRTKVFAQDIRDNFFVDSSWNTQAALVLTAVYPTTSVFATTTTVVLDQVTNKEYEDAIVYALAPNDLMNENGDFAIITGGTPGTLAVNGSTQTSVNGAATSPPFGWTASGVITGAVWNAVIDSVNGSWVCYCPGSGTTFNLATLTITLTPAAVTRYFVLGFTSKGWTAVKLDGVSIYDSGASATAYHTEVVKFSMTASTASFVLTLGTNATASFWAEMRLFEIGSAEYNEPGALGLALTKSVKRLMKRGAY